MIGVNVRAFHTGTFHQVRGMIMNWIYLYYQSTDWAWPPIRPTMRELRAAFGWKTRNKNEGPGMYAKWLAARGYIKISRHRYDYQRTIQLLRFPYDPSRHAVTRNPPQESEIPRREADSVLSFSQRHYGILRGLE